MPHLLVFMIEFLLNITVRKHFIEFFNLFFFSVYVIFGWGEKRIGEDFGISCVFKSHV